jgi:hypothetical protein
MISATIAVVVACAGMISTVSPAFSIASCVDESIAATATFFRTGKISVPTMSRKFVNASPLVKAAIDILPSVRNLVSLFPWRSRFTVR